ncbi:MAG: glutamine cyclotransferase [Rhodospirillaceae bacterium]|nr:glutamine cyclotransferase [Rhodospirillaceae bacterium]|tara:strand:- start:971 stop:1741 length:771 start_codon:yes stop_codon:yes gene_type:complete
MLTRIIFLAVLLIAGFAWFQATPGIDRTEWAANVVASYPHDPSAYTQGLAIHNGKLYEGTGQYGRSSVRRVDLLTGNIESRRALRFDYFGEGITVFDGELYQLTWKSGLGFVYELDTLNLLRTFRIEGEGWGLTHDEESLIMSNGTPQLAFLDPKTLEVERQITVLDNGEPVNQLNELEFIHNEIWANVWFEERIARISPSDGEVLGWIDLSGLYPRSQRGYDDVLNGIAFDSRSERLFVTGKNWPRLYEIELVMR